MPTTLQVMLTDIEIPEATFNALMAQRTRGRELWMTMNLKVGDDDHGARLRLAGDQNAPANHQDLADRMLEMALDEVAVDEEEIEFRCKLELTNPRAEVGRFKVVIDRPILPWADTHLLPVGGPAGDAPEIAITTQINLNPDLNVLGDNSLRQDDRGKAVVGLQEWLLAKGFLIVEPEPGVFDEPTKQAVLAVQLSAWLRPDGIVGEGTRTAMLNFEGTALTAGWHPYATRYVVLPHRNDPTQNYGPPRRFVDGTRRGVLHTTQGQRLPRYQTIEDRQGNVIRYGIFAPHFTIGRDLRGRGNRRAAPIGLWQHFPLTCASRALRSGPEGPDGYETNALGAIQIEIIGYAEGARANGRVGPAHINDDEELAAAVRELMRWIKANAGVDLVCNVEFARRTQAEGLEAPVRLHRDQWMISRGWLGHQHVPNNEHWDPGCIDIDFLLDRQ